MKELLQDREMFCKRAATSPAFFFLAASAASCLISINGEKDWVAG
jgi:hypothetical protein